MSLSVLFDGWPLVYQPNSPAALHLYSLLRAFPEPGLPLLALPGPGPDWLPSGISTHRITTPDIPAARLGWEQRTLPDLAKRLEAHLLHHTTPVPPLFGPAVSVLSPTSAGSGQHEAGFAGRLRASLSAGGMTRLRAQFWPEDLPPPAGSAPLYRLPATIDPAADLQAELVSEADRGFDLPESYVLYHGPTTPSDLRRVLEAWGWAAGALSQQVRLVLVGLDQAGNARLKALASAYNLAETVQALPALPPDVLPALYRGCQALFSPALEPPWGGPLRLALACSRPVVAVISSIAEAIVGPAAYLLQPQDLRGLGAALITTVIEEELAARLSRAARERAAGWQTGAFGPALLAAYREIVSRGTSR